MNFTIKTGDGGLKFTNEAPWQITITFLKRGKLVSMYILTYQLNSTKNSLIV